MMLVKKLKEAQLLANNNSITHINRIDNQLREVVPKVVPKVVP
jgi:hypothetical protein